MPAVLTSTPAFDSVSQARKSVETSLDAADTSVRATSVGGLRDQQRLELLIVVAMDVNAYHENIAAKTMDVYRSDGAWTRRSPKPRLEPKKRRPSSPTRIAVLAESQAKTEAANRALSRQWQAYLNTLSKN
jgi:hypothetical protein